MKQIPLTQGLWALVDDSDYEVVSQFTWHTAKRGKKLFYAETSVGYGETKRNIYLHRFLIPDSEEVHHKDGDGLNCQRFNLIAATRTTNSRGFIRKKSDTTSPYRGVCWKARDSRWEANIVEDKKQTYLGFFKYAHEAALAYDREAVRRWAEQASPNFRRVGREGRTTILMVGWGRSGKDAGAEILAELTGLRYGFSFSRAALPFMCEVLGQDEKTAWEERHNHRTTWKNHLDHLREGDETLLAEMALGHGEILAGLRDIKELEAVRKKSLFSHILWVHRPGIPPDPTTTFGPEDADEVIDNSGTLDEYRETLRQWAIKNHLCKSSV